MLTLLDDDASRCRLLGTDSDPEDAGLVEVEADGGPGVRERGGTEPALGFFVFSFSSTASNKTSRNRIPYTMKGLSCPASHAGIFLNRSSMSWTLEC